MDLDGFIPGVMDRIDSMFGGTVAFFKKRTLLASLNLGENNSLPLRACAAALLAGGLGDP